MHNLYAARHLAHFFQRGPHTEFETSVLHCGTTKHDDLVNWLILTGRGLRYRL